MHLQQVLPLSIAAMLLISLGASAGDDENRQSAKEISYKTTDGEEAKVRAWLYLPQDYEKDESKKWPLVMFLHGAGERGEDLELVKKHGPPKLVEKGKDFPFILVSPQCPRGRFWKTEELKAVVDMVSKSHRVDGERVYVTGLSMGGFGSWAVLAAYPDTFAAAIPICGGGDPKTAVKIKHIPIWAFHGDKDRAVPIGRSQAIVDALKDAGGNVKFTVYEGVGHDSWTKTYDNPEVYAWLLKQTRK